MRKFTLPAFLALLISCCNSLPTGPAPAPDEFVRGITLASWYRDGYSRPTAESAIREISDLGATHLVIMIPGHQASRTSSQVRNDSIFTPTEASVKQALDWAAAAGLQTVLKPHVLLDDGTWIGKFSPADPDTWFASYRAFVLGWAVLAENAGSAQFVVGTELAGTVRHEQLWRETIREVRAAFSGELIYAASWDEAGNVPFWDELDIVGVDAWYPVTRRKDPGRLEILAGWQPWLAKLDLLQKQTGRKIILAEIGYRSIDGAGMQPYRYDNSCEIDLAEQADLYWAALQATADVENIAGIYWWNWAADGSGGALNDDFTPFGKPARMELARSWRKIP